MEEICFDKIYCINGYLLMLKMFRFIFMLLIIKKVLLMLYIFIFKKFMLFNVCFRGCLYINIDVIFIFVYVEVICL